MLCFGSSRFQLWISAVEKVTRHSLWRTHRIIKDQIKQNVCLAFESLKKMAAAPQGRSKQVVSNESFIFHTYLQKIKPPTRNWLVGGSKYFLFSARTLGKISILTNIFQRGWNHQLAEVESNHPQFPFASFFRLALFKRTPPATSLQSLGGEVSMNDPNMYIYIHIICWYMNVCIYIYMANMYIYIHVFMGTCVYIMCIYIYLCAQTD